MHTSNLVPEWLPSARISQLSCTAGMSDNEDLDDETEPADDDKEFLKLLDSELDKVTHFYVSKVSPSA